MKLSGPRWWARGRRLIIKKSLLWGGVLPLPFGKIDKPIKCYGGTVLCNSSTIAISLGRLGRRPQIIISRRAEVRESFATRRCAIFRGLLPMAQIGDTRAVLP